jgi:citrate synthase
MQLGDDPSKGDVKAFTEKTLSSGKVVPGFGHAVLRKTVSNYEASKLSTEQVLEQQTGIHRPVF